jgi:hypothetical protein
MPVYWTLFLFLTQFLWCKTSDPSASPLLSECCDSFLFVFQVCRAIWLWVLLTGSGDELFWTATWPISGSVLSPACCQPPAFPAFVYWILVEISSLLLPPSLVHFQSSCPLCCVLVSSSLNIVQVFFVGEGSVCLRGYAGLSQVWLGEDHVMFGTHLIGLPNVSQLGLEPALGGSSPPIFSM